MPVDYGSDVSDADSPGDRVTPSRYTAALKKAVPELFDESKYKLVTEYGTMFSSPYQPTLPSNQLFDESKDEFPTKDGSVSVLLDRYLKQRATIPNPTHYPNPTPTPNPNPNPNPNPTH
jgi:hypothetical protein